MTPDCPTSRKAPRRRTVRLFRIMIAVAAVLSFYELAQADETAPEPGIHFVCSNLLSTAHGTFHAWRISGMHVDSLDPAAGWVAVEVDVESVDTGIDRRDEHLRTADFFDVKTHPTASARVHDITPDGQTEDGRARYTAQFDLDLHGVRKTLPGRFEFVSMSPPVVTGTLELNRRDFGIGDSYSAWNPMSVKEQVQIHFTVPLPVAP